MRSSNSLQSKILTLPELQKKIAQWRLIGKTIVFTNDCSDILDAGHIASLTEAAQQGDILIIGVNANASIKSFTGNNRHINNENERALLLASLAMVDAVVLFSETTPLELILPMKPDVLVKGADYKIEDIAGANEVMKWGCTVIITRLYRDFLQHLSIKFKIAEASVVKHRGCPIFLPNV